MNIEDIIKKIDGELFYSPTFGDNVCVKDGTVYCCDGRVEIIADKDTAICLLSEVTAKYTVVPCELCGTPTYKTGTKRCDPCYELEWRIINNPVVALKVLKDNSIDKFNKGKFLLDAFEKASRDYYSSEEGVEDNVEELEKEYERTLKELEDYINGSII